MRFGAALLLYFTAFPLSGQTVPSFEVAKRDARSKYQLGHIYAAAELTDGRVVATDTKESVFRVIDFDKGEVGIIGKPGDDSDAYRRAAGILPIRDDSFALIDPVGHKALHIASNGAVGSFAALPAATPDRPLFLPVASDSTGALYYMAPIRFTPGSTALPTEGHLLRLFPDGARVDTALTWTLRRADQVEAGLMPFVFSDAWAVRRDGLLARVVADTYQVQWFRDGKATGTTGPLPFAPIPITEAEQQAIHDSVMNQFKAMSQRPGATAMASMSSPGGMSPATVTFMGSSGGGGMMITRTDGGPPPSGGATPAPAPANGRAMTMQSIDPSKMPWGAWPATKPPIPSNGNPARFDAQGRLWILRQNARGDLTPHYDIVTPDKGLVAHVDLPKGTRLIAFGTHALYLLRTDDGSDWMERYPMPGLP